MNFWKENKIWMFDSVMKNNLENDFWYLITF